METVRKRNKTSLSIEFKKHSFTVLSILQHILSMDSRKSLLSYFLTLYDSRIHLLDFQHWSRSKFQHVQFELINLVTKTKLFWLKQRYPFLDFQSTIVF